MLLEPRGPVGAPPQPWTSAGTRDGKANRLAGTRGEYSRIDTLDCVLGDDRQAQGHTRHWSAAGLYQSAGVKAGGGWPVAGQGRSLSRCLKSCEV